MEHKGDSTLSVSIYNSTPIVQEILGVQLILEQVNVNLGISSLVLLVLMNFMQISLSTFSRFTLAVLDHMSCNW